MKETTILIVDDEEEIREWLATCLREHQFKILEARNGSEAIQVFENDQCDLVLLDVMMPGMDGFAVCDYIRKSSTVPVIFLTGKQGTEDLIQGMEIGGDDYVTKPFLPDVLVARIKACLRRSHMCEANDVIVFDSLMINLLTYEVRFREKVVPFLAKELKLFIFLAERPRQVFTADQLYEHVWEIADGDARTVMVHISNIRRKLNQYAPGSVRIETLKGIGYRLVPEK